MALVTDFSTLFNFIEFETWNGQYSGSLGSEDFSGAFTNITYQPSVQAGTLNSTELVTTGFNTYYKMQGFNTATGRYEIWFSREKPLLIPPSGNPLSNIEIVLIWVDR